MTKADFIWWLNVTLRDKSNPYLGAFRRKKLKGIDFTIISNNCWGGHVYRWYDLPYQSPTIGLYFWADDYLRFVTNLKHYILNCELEFVTPEESAHYSSLKELNQLNIPIGKLGDIEIVFLHYKTAEEAKEKWLRRCERINWNHILVKNSYMNKCSEEIMHSFTSLPYKHKLFFVGKYVDDGKTTVYGRKGKSLEVVEDTIYFNRFVDLTKWINESYEGEG